MLLLAFRNTTRGSTFDFSKTKLLLNSFSHLKRAMNESFSVASAEIASNPAAVPQQLQSSKSQQLKSKATPPMLRKDKQQQAAKKKTTPYIPGTVTLQVLGAGANGAPTAVYLFTDQSRYLFNCGEGTQRLAHEHKTKLARLEQIFVTRNTWSMIGGFPGLALTVQDAGVRELALHGPPHLDSILHSMKRFVVLKNLQVKTKDCSEETEFEDGVMNVKCIALKSITQQENIAIAYLCKLKPRPGALNLEKCVAAGVTPGPLLGLLKNGIDVTLDNGNVVRSKDVSEPGETSLCFLILDIPSTDYLPALQQQAEFFQATQSQAESSISLVLHFSPPEMLNNNCYKEFVKQQFDSGSCNTQHIYLNATDNCFSGYVSAHRIQWQLNQLHKGMFPLLAEGVELTQTSGISSKLKKTKLSEELLLENEEIVPQTKQTEIVGLNTLTSFHLRPRKGLDRTLEAKLNPCEYIAETQALEEFPAALQKLQNDLKAFPALSENNNNHAQSYPKLTFLGTGSCVPNKTRNVSSILLQPHANSSIILDCGEGTLGQIVRFFGKTQAEHIMRTLHAIYVSHLHADHHIGLIGLLKERQRLLGNNESEDFVKLLLLAPKQIEPWLRFYDTRIESIANSYELICNADMLVEPKKFLETHAHMGVHSIATCLVRHCPHSFGVRLDLPADNQIHDGKQIKITYSGDTMPCEDMIELGRNSSILIHEATMEDDLIDEAKIKMHSTLSQAISQGQAMQAEHIILTHFSQRYAKLPRMQLNEHGQQQHENVSIAFDNMQVCLQDLQKFRILYPALRALFAEHAEELEQKALKRELKQERKRKLMNAD